MKCLTMQTLLWAFVCGLCAAPPAALAVDCAVGAPTHPDTSYTVNNVTVVDKQTGLTWKRCSEGQSWGGTSCTGTAGKYVWRTALQRAEDSSFAGFNDWRLPNIKELQSLVEWCRSTPAINTMVFPNTPSSDFWSGSPDADSSDLAWGVYFNDGRVNGKYRNNSRHVRLVRGGQ